MVMTDIGDDGHDYLGEWKEPVWPHGFKFSDDIQQHGEHIYRTYLTTIDTMMDQWKQQQSVPPSSAASSSTTPLVDTRVLSAYLYIAARASFDGLFAVYDEKKAVAMWHMAASLPNHNGEAAHALGYCYDNAAGCAEDTKVISILHYICTR
jgi:hypothetical protein